MTRTRDREDIYRPGERFVDAALRRDDSLFTPDEPVWSLAVLEDLHRRFVERPDDSSDSFETKLSRQLAGAPSPTIQLMAEMLFVHLLLPIDIRAETKRQTIATVLGWSPAPLALPADLSSALERGFVHTGVAYNTYHPQQLAFLVDFALAWKRLPQSTREALLADPWRFKEMVWGVNLSAAQSQREALLHLVFPDTFEDIVSQKAKRQIADRFRDLVSAPTKDVDRQLEQIRRRLADAHGAGFSFYEAEVAARWQPEASKWGQFIQWARRFYESASFDREERDYKLAVAAKVQAARDALLNGRPWRKPLRDAFSNPQNNLTSWQTHDRFLQWVEQAPEPAAEALRALWAAEGTAADRIRGFLERLPDAAVHGPGSRLTIASFLHLAHDPTSYPHYKETQIRKGCDLTGYPRPDKGADEVKVYEHALRFLDQLS
jgi:5-methylcytosine-specific restriction protein B